MRKFLLAAAVATALALGLPAAASAAPAAPAPASAATVSPAKVTPHGGGNSFTICFPVYVNPPGIMVWECFTIVIPEETAGPGTGGCPQCGEAILLGYDPIDYKIQPSVVNELGQGYTLLGQASITKDPAEAAKLHDSAISEFTSAARLLGSSKVSEKDVGYIDPGKGTFEPEPQPWRQQAATDVVKALGNLQSYVAKGNTKLLTAATSQLDDSFQDLAKNAGTQTVG
jgi:hypothetical protein